MRKLTEPGKWYFVVNCLHCQNPIPLAEAPSPDEKSDPLRYRAVSKLRCPHCNREGTYAPHEVSRQLVEYSPEDRIQTIVLYLFAGIAGLSFIAALLFVTLTYR